ncbi:MAG: hypothetical protein AABP62_18025 [Planctomycetota bacterium]
MTRFFSALVGLSLVSMVWSSEARADHWGLSFSTGPSYGYVGPSFQGYNGYGYAGPSFQAYAPQVNYGYGNYSRGHYDYYPGSYVRHRGHYDYIPPHAHYHRGGHSHHGGHGHRH